MDQTFRTIIYAAPRFDVEELLTVRKDLGKMMGKEFVKSADEDENAINKVVSQNYKLKMYVGCCQYQH